MADGQVKFERNQQISDITDAVRCTIGFKPINKKRYSKVLLKIPKEEKAAMDPEIT